MSYYSSLSLSPSSSFYSKHTHIIKELRAFGSDAVKVYTKEFPGITFNYAIRPKLLDNNCYRYTLEFWISTKDIEIRAFYITCSCLANCLYPIIVESDYGKFSKTCNSLKSLQSYLIKSSMILAKYAGAAINEIKLGKWK